jgi:hypothetical protein
MVKKEYEPDFCNDALKWFKLIPPALTFKSSAFCPHSKFLGSLEFPQ